MSRGRVLIVGAGIGGLATAIALGQAEYEVEVIEDKPDLHSSTYGVGVIQHPNQLRALDAIDCAQACIDQGFTAVAMSKIYTQEGELERVVPGPRIQRGDGTEYPPLNGVTRPRLHRILTDKAESVGAKITYSTLFTEIKSFDDHAEVTLTDGATRNVDFVVGADGVYSATRAHVLPTEVEPQYSGKSAIRFNVPRLPENDAIIHVLGVAPDGEEISTGIVPLAEDLSYAYVNVRWDRSVRLSQQEMIDLTAEKIRDFGGPMGVIRDNYLAAGEEIVMRSEEYLIAPLPWHKGRIVLIGDAVHAVTPNTAQGAAQAIEDGIVLAQELLRHDLLEDAFVAYEERRYERCKLVVDYGARARQHEFKPIPGFDSQAEGLRMRESLVDPF